MSNPKNPRDITLTREQIDAIKGDWRFMPDDGSFNEYANMYFDEEEPE